MRSLLVVLVLDMQEQRLDVFRFGIAAMLIQGQVVVGQVSLKLAHIFDQGLILALEGQISGVILVDVLNLLLHLIDLGSNLIVLVFHQVVVVVAIVDLPSWSDTSSSLNARETRIRNRTFD